MVTIKRELSQVLSQTNKSILLLGPRQTGKSTLIETLKPDITFNLSDEGVSSEFHLN